MNKEKSSKTIEILKKYLNPELAEKLEKGIFIFSNDYATTNETDFLLESIYDTKLDEILEGLNNNSELIKYYETEYLKNKNKILEDILLLPYSEPEKINPNKYDKLLKKKEIEEYKKNDVKSSNAFTCSKCKKSKCSVIQKQTRAGDEPITTFVTCLECGNAFTFN